MATGAQALLTTLVRAGVTACFTNPGTSEMHFVAALDRVPEMRAVLTLFEGVATGAADGYARMAGRPAATLLHLGPGLGNGLANLHNARRARVPLVNIVGDHATYHVPFDAQLQSDIETVARNVSPHFVRTAASALTVAQDAADAIAAACGPPPQIATLIVPADVSWGEGAEAVPPLPLAPGPPAENDVIDAIREVLGSGKRTALLLGGAATHGPALRTAARIATATGATLFAEVFPTRLERGAGVPRVERLAYFAEMVTAQLAGYQHLVLVDTAAPVSFFAYPDKKSYLVPDGCEVHRLALETDDVAGSLAALADAVGVGPNDASARQRAVREATHRKPATGPLDADAVCRTVAALLPEGAIVSDEALTSGASFAAASAGAPPHDVLTLAGGAIGQGLPVAVGAAVACPDRPVIALQADGSAMYTIQSLWTMAREGLDITVVIFNNRSYGILEVELQRVRAAAGGPRAHAQLDLGSPALDFVAIAAGMGVPSVRATTSLQFTAQLSNALAEPGPHLIEAVIPPVFTGRRLRTLPYALRAMEALPAGLAKAVKRRIAP